jgi:hypothetical protein
LAGAGLKYCLQAVPDVGHKVLASADKAVRKLILFFDKIVSGKGPILMKLA